MHAVEGWHNLKWSDTVIGQKSSICKQASVRQIKATLKVWGLVKPTAQKNHTYNKKEKKKEEEEEVEE